MAAITNNSPGVRIVNVKDGKDVKQVAIRPGETVEGDPVETDAFNGSVESGELSVTGSKKAGESDAEKRAELVAELKALGVNADTTSSVKELEAELKKAKSAPKLPGA